MSKTTASTPASATPVPVSMPAFSPRTLLQVLWGRARHNMPPHELEWVVDGVHAFTFQYAGQLEAVFEGLGCLVSVDGNASGACISAGSFQGGGSDLPDLLFAQATHLGLLSALARTAEEAGDMLRYPERT